MSGICFTRQAEIRIPIVSWRSLRRWGWPALLAVALLVSREARGEDNLHLTPQEKQWIAGHPVVRYSGEPDWPPIEFAEDGEYRGIASGYLDLLSSQTGLTFEYVPVSDWNEALTKIKAGELDLLPCVGNTPERREYLAFTPPYLSFPLVIVTRKDLGFVSSLKDLAGRRMAVPKGFYTHELLKRDYPDLPLVVTETESAALRAVATGNADAFIGNLAVASHLIDRLGLTSLKVAAPTEYENSKLSMAVRPTLPVLLSILTKGLAGLPAEEQNRVRQNWIGVRYEHGLDPKTVWRAAGLAALVIGPVALASWYYTQRLRRQVARRRAAEARLAQKKAVLEATLGNMAQGILMVNSEGTVLAYNARYREFFGYTDAFLQKRPNIADIFRDYWGPRGYDDDAIEKTIEDSRRRDFFEYELALGDGRIIDVMHNPAPDGGVVRTYTDITQRKEQEEETRRLGEAAEAASRAKGAFLANMSHEIRTPLNAIIGFGQLLRRGPNLSEEDREQVDIMIRSAEHLLSVINDVLNMSKLEAGRAELTVGDFEPRELLIDVANMFRLKMREKGLRFDLHVAEDLPARGQADEGKLRQIVINLLSNAVKFTNAGHVTLRASATPVPGQNAGCLRIEVEDTGPGIAAEEMDKLFQAFGQTTTGIKAKGGTGLGLAISREYARMMGGDITVLSQPGSGSTFTLEILLQGVAAQDGPGQCETTEAEATLSLAHLSREMRQRMVAAAERADYGALVALVDELQETDRSAAEAVGLAVANFRYAEIIAMAGAMEEGMET